MHIKSKTKKLTRTGTLEQGFARHSPGNNSSDDFYYVLQKYITFNLAYQSTGDCHTVAPPYGNAAPSVLLNQQDCKAQGLLAQDHY